MLRYVRQSEAAQRLIYVRARGAGGGERGGGVRGVTYAWGNADHGQLGLPPCQLQDEGDTFGRQSPIPQTIPVLRDVHVAAAATSSSHSAFVCGDGALLTCGYNGQGQLGLGDLENRDEPTRVASLPPLKGVACGARHTVALSRDGLVFTFGANAQGQLGLPACAESAGEDSSPPITPVASPSTATSPQLVKRLAEDGRRIVDIAAGDDFTVALSDTGRVFTWGAAHYGALGHTSPLPTSPLVSFLLRSTPANDEHPRVVRALAKCRIVSISTGRRHAVAIDEGGGVHAWGNGRHFLLGTGEETDAFEPVLGFTKLGAIRKVACGTAHSLVLTGSGAVFAVGDNDHGCLGIDSRSPFSCAVEPVLVPLSSPARDIAAGWHVSAAVLANGSVHTWGCASAGALGCEGGADIRAPQDIGLKAKRVFIGSGGTSVVATA